MKKFILVLLILSIIMGIKTNIGWFTLFGNEFSGPIAEIKAGTFPANRYYLGTFLLIVHLSLFSLFFTEKLHYYNWLLSILPPAFVIASILFDPFNLILLIPFIMVWLLSMWYYFKKFKRSKSGFSNQN